MRHQQPTETKSGSPKDLSLPSRELLLLIVLIVSSFAMIAATPLARAQPTPTVAIAPALIGNVGSGTHVTFNVTLQGFPTFSSYDIQVKVNGCLPSCTVINATSVTVSSLLPSPSVAIRCINGVGGGCSASDGPGVVHVAASSFSYAAGSGTLFSIDYQAVASSGSTPVNILNGTLVIGDPAGNDICHDTVDYPAGCSFNNGFYGLGLSNTATTVFDASTNKGWSGSETIGASAYDTAAVITSGTVIATGTVSYTFYANGVCSGAVWTQTLPLTGTGKVPSTVSTGALAAGSYSFRAVYSGDGNYAGSTSPCELFTVKVSTKTTTVVLDAAGSNVTNTGIPLGSTVRDNATVGVRAPGGGPFPGPCPANLPCISVVPASRTLPSPGGTFVLNVNFTNMPPFAGWFISVKTDTLVLNATGIVLVETFGGTATVRSNCANGVGSCNANDGGGVVTFAGQSFTGNDHGNGTLFSIIYNVVGGPAANVTYVNIIFSEVFDSSGMPIIDCSATPNQCLTNSISVAEPFPITGTVTYNFFTNNNCAGTALVSETVALGSPSSPHGPLAAGSYSFNSVYSGNTNYLASTSSCEPFSVSKSIANISTVVFDAATLSPWSGSETTAASAAYDTATLTGVSGYTPTGTFVYTFYTNGICSSTGIATDNVTLTKTGTVPISKTEGQWVAGNYSFQAIYSGDSNYVSSNGACERFTVMPPSGIVGGTVLPLNKLVLLIPYLVLASAILIGLVAFSLKPARAAKHQVRKFDTHRPN